MHLTTILLTIVAILMILVGLLALVGSKKQERYRFVWFFVAMLGGACWTMTSGIQLWNTSGSEFISSCLSYGICLGSLFAGLGLLGYYLPNIKAVARKLILAITSLLCVALMVVPLFDFSLLAGVLKGESNWFYMSYGIFLSLIFIAVLISAIVRINQTRNKKLKHGSIILFLGMLTTIVLSIIFNMVFPFVLHTNEFLWIGPLSIYILVLTFYLNLFSAHRIGRSSAWFKILSYAIVVASCAIVYMILFFLIFTSLFRVASPSSSVILLNFIMVAIVLLLTPVIVEVGSFVRSLISIDQIDVGYVLKKLKRVDGRHLNVQELAEFLGNHLHLAYFGVVLNGRLYESEDSNLDAQTLKAINSLKPTKHNIWHDLDNAHGQVIKGQKIVAVADLYDDKDEVIGQALIGKPINERRFSRREFIQLESVVNMVAIIVAPKKHKRK